MREPPCQGLKAPGAALSYNALRHSLQRQGGGAADTAGTSNEATMQTPTSATLINNANDQSSPPSRLLVPVLAAMALAVLGAYVMVLNQAVDRGQAVRAAFAAGQFAAEETIEPNSQPLLVSTSATR